MAKNKIAKKVVNDNNVTFAFVDGRDLVCNIADLTTEIIDRLALHGLSQKVGDSYASAETIDEAFAAASTTWDNLVNGLWATKVSRGGKLVEALSRATGKTYEECLEAVSKMSEEEKRALRKHPDVKKALADIEAEIAARAAKAAQDIDAPSLTALFN